MCKVGKTVCSNSQNVLACTEAKLLSGAPVKYHMPSQTGTGTDVPVVALIAYESKQKPRGTQGAKIG
jgi:hypothetical protein